MQGLGKILHNYCTEALFNTFAYKAQAHDIVINETKPEFSGHYTLVTFALSKALKKAPAQIAQELGEALLQYSDVFASFECIQGFLNVTFTQNILLQALQQVHTQPLTASSNGQKVMVEFASPNTNKPIHLGHLRNIFLGDSISRILEDEGYEVVRANLTNDRGIHICKSMFAWQKFGNGATPQSTGIKGDHLVGDYYVRFETMLREEVNLLQKQLAAGNLSNISDSARIEIKKLQDAKQAQTDTDKINEIEGKIVEQLKLQTPCMRGAQDMLIKWEHKDEPTLELWRTMNQWVYDGFEFTYRSLDVQFDKYYYESDTYLLGKDVVQKGLAKQVLFAKEDGSVWADLTSDGYDQKLLLRSNGTSVYMTQDIGTAILKHQEYAVQKSIYVIADEQNYHMQVLKLVLQKMQEPCAEGIHHLSYGMVELPNGKMKSREGNVVDADEIVAEMIATSEAHTKSLGKTEGFTDNELQRLYKQLGIGALKFYLLRVEPKRRMIFNPEESIDFHGFTGPFVQYAYARISSILRKESAPLQEITSTENLLPLEEKLILILSQFAHTRAAAANDHNPSLVALYAYNVAKTFNGFIAEHKVLHAESESKKNLRLQLCASTKRVLAHCMGLLGAEVPEKM
jgi:arginyl-tRNA synthetase